MLYREIALKIAEKINHDQEQDKLPTEKELMQEYDASRNTIRNALTVLTDAGLLISRAGMGYYINHWKLKNAPTLNFNSRTSYTRQFYADSKAHSNEVLRFEETTCPQEVADIMKIEAGEPMYLVARHRDQGYYNENYEFSLYRQKLIPYLSKEIVSGHIFDFIQKHYSLVDEHSDYYIRQSGPDNPFKEILKTPKLYVTAVHSTNQESFAYSEVYYLNEQTAFYVRSK